MSWWPDTSSPISRLRSTEKRTSRIKVSTVWSKVHGTAAQRPGAGQIGIQIPAVLASVGNEQTTGCRAVRCERDRYLGSQNELVDHTHPYVQCEDRCGVGAGDALHGRAEAGVIAAAGERQHQAQRDCRSEVYAHGDLRTCARLGAATCRRSCACAAASAECGRSDMAAIWNDNRHDPVARPPRQRHPAQAGAAVGAGGTAHVGGGKRGNEQKSQQQEKHIQRRERIRQLQAPH